MDWLILGLIANILFSISNFIDKYLVENQFKKNIFGLIIISSFIPILILPIIFIINPAVIAIDFFIMTILTLNGFLFILYLIPYLKALELEDTSIVVSIFLLTPVIQLVLGNLFLNETINLFQGVGMLLIIIGSVLININFNKKLKINKKVFGLMLISCSFIAVSDLIFKLFVIETDFLTASFWQYTGYLLLGIILISITKFRVELFKILKKNSGFIIGINLTNEILNIVAIIIRSFVLILVPIGIANILGGTQAGFNLIIAILLTTFIPTKFNEDITRKGLTKKIIAIIIMIIGLYLITLF